MSFTFKSFAIAIWHPKTISRKFKAEKLNLIGLFFSAGQMRLFQIFPPNQKLQKSD